MSIDFLPLRRVPHGDACCAAPGPLLEEAERLQKTPPHRDTNEILPLLEENARLRRLAVKLSNLLGDLPTDANGDR
jgi:hypothetical protein